jgi:hypothetical protein
MLSASGESVPNPGGAVTIAKYAPPTQSGTGSVAAWVSALGGSGKPAGVFKSSAPNGVELLLRSGGATGVNGAVFSQFKAVVINDAGHFATLATAIGGGLKKSDDDGLWASDSTRSLRLLAREGDMPPGVPGGQWHSFSSVAIAETPGSTVAFVAKMKPKAGGVSAATDTGLWATGSDGVVRLLLREGDVLPGNAGRNVKSFTVLSAVPTSGSQERSLAKSGKLVVRVLAQDRSEHLLQLTVP